MQPFKTVCQAALCLVADLSFEFSWCATHIINANRISKNCEVNGIARYVYFLFEKGLDERVKSILSASAVYLSIPCPYIFVNSIRWVRCSAWVKCANLIEEGLWNDSRRSEFHSTICLVGTEIFYNLPTYFRRYIGPASSNIGSNTSMDGSGRDLCYAAPTLTHTAMLFAVLFTSG